MDIDYAIIADYAEIAAGKLFLMGGGWDNYRLPEVPGQLRMAMVVGVRVDWDETNQNIPVRLTVEDDDGQVHVRIDGAVAVGRPAQLPPGATQLAQLSANVSVDIQRHGGFRVVVVVGEGENVRQRTLPFRVSPS